MARYSLTSQSVASGAGSADAAVITAALFYLGGNAAGMRLNINEIQAGGEATASAVQILVLARDSTNAATPTAGASKVTAMDAMSTGQSTALISGQTATTLPTRSSSHLIQHSFNAFGGLVRWQARQGEEITVFGNTASNSELSYSAFTGNANAAVSSHCILEQV